MLVRPFIALRLIVSALLIASVVSGCGKAAAPSALPAGNLPQSSIRHVFVIMLENKSYSETFAANTAAPYLAQTLPAQGALLQNYYGTGHVSLDNYVSFVSGQSPTVQTDNDCTTGYSTITPGTVTTNGQIQGAGCVYPATVLTVADQMSAAGFTWKGYMGDMGNDPSRESTTCGHPAIGSIDATQTAEAPTPSILTGDAYATRHDPFMYFHSIIDAPSCNTNVVNLNALTSDLNSATTTANLTFITPNLCDDGHDSPCAVDGKAGGLPRINTFLQTWVPKIMNSPAYQKDGLLLITFDESDTSSVTAGGGVETIVFNGATCCGELEGPNLGAFPQTSSLTVPGITVNLTKSSFGGDLVGAIALSPFIVPGTVSTTPYNHYSSLATIENIFGLSHLGYAGVPGLAAFGTDVFTRL
jgi:phosphatidylinositol-3-phosphatase